MLAGILSRRNTTSPRAYKTQGAPPQSATAATTAIASNQSASKFRGFYKKTGGFRLL